MALVSDMHMWDLVTPIMYVCVGLCSEQKLQQVNNPLTSLNKFEKGKWLIINDRKEVPV